MYQSEEYVFVQHPTQTVQLTDLDKGTEYTVTVSVNNTAGFSPESDSHTAITQVDCKFHTCTLTLIWSYKWYYYDYYHTFTVKKDSYTHVFMVSILMIYLCYTLLYYVYIYPFSQCAYNMHFKYIMLQVFSTMHSSDRLFMSLTCVRIAVYS